METARELRASVFYEKKLYLWKKILNNNWNSQLNFEGRQKYPHWMALFDNFLIISKMTWISGSWILIRSTMGNYTLCLQYARIRASTPKEQLHNLEKDCLFFYLSQFCAPKYMLKKISVICHTILKIRHLESKSLNSNSGTVV